MRVWGFLFSSLRFLEKLLCGWSRQDFTHSSLFISFLTSFFEKTQILSSLITWSSSVLSPSFWPKRWWYAERDINIWSARAYRHSHTQKHTSTTYKHNVCCYSTNRVHRRPQGHQGSGTLYFFFFTFWSLSFLFFAMRRKLAMGDDEHRRRKCLTFLLTRARSWGAPNVHETLRIWTRGYTCTLFFFMCAFYRELYASCILSLRVCIFRRR